MKLGMFEGSATFLSAEVDASASPLAAEAVRRGSINGAKIVSGQFRAKGELEEPVSGMTAEAAEVAARAGII